jgi:hypothetical protein
MPTSARPAVGTTLSDTSAVKEYGITKHALTAALQAGKLSYQVNYCHGNPWFRLKRSEVEQLFVAQHGQAKLQVQQNRTAIAKAMSEIRHLEKRLRILRNQAQAWEQEQPTSAPKIRGERVVADRSKPVTGARIRLRTQASR